MKRNKPIFRSLYNKYRDMSMTRKISFSFMMVLIPVLIFTISMFALVLSYNEHYTKAVENSSIISEFSIDFKENYDYEIYLIIVGNKTFYEVNPIRDIEDARGIIKQVRRNTENVENIQRLEVADTYLNKLQKYTNQIRDNIIIGGMYDRNKEIWEMDIQSITSNIQNTILEILYYEGKQSAETFHDMKEVTNVMVIISINLMIFLLLATVFTVTILPRTITKPIRQLSLVTQQVAEGNLEVRSGIRHGAEVKILSQSLDQMIEKISFLIDRVTLEQINLREAELRILQSQINPHFLYNTLDTIVWLAEAGDQQAVVNMVETLSEFFRATLNGGKDIVSIDSEKKHISSYLQIQKVRYQDILDYKIDIPSEICDCQIPKITLQPLVENALYHGIKYKRQPGLIKVSGQMNGEYCILTIEDNGVGMDAEKLRCVQEGLVNAEDASEFFGLYNVNERIRLKFGEQYGLKIDSVLNEGTKVEVKLPYQIVNEE